jgi:hypothetical protein
VQRRRSAAAKGQDVKCARLLKKKRLERSSLLVVSGLLFAARTTFSRVARRVRSGLGNKYLQFRLYLDEVQQCKEFEVVTYHILFFFPIQRASCNSNRKHSALLS